MRRATFMIVVVLALLATGFSTGAGAKGTGGARSAALRQSADYDCDDGADTTTGTTYGSVLFNSTGKPGASKAIVVVFKIRGAADDTTFDLYVTQHPGSCTQTKLASVRTDEEGNATKQLRVAKGSSSDVVWGSAIAGSTKLRTIAVAVD